MSKRCRIRLCSCKQEEPLQRVAWGWSIHNIVESESDPLTRRAVDLFEKEPLKGNSEVHLHTPTKFGEDRSKDLGGDREQTDRQTDKRCSIYSMILWWQSNPYEIELNECRKYIRSMHIYDAIFRGGGMVNFKHTCNVKLQYQIMQEVVSSNPRGTWQIAGFLFEWVNIMPNRETPSLSPSLSLSLFIIYFILLDASI